MIIYLMRHFEAKKHPILGYTLDELTEDGERKALETARIINFNIDKLLSSPNIRSIKTAEPIAIVKELEITLDKRLGEFNRGVYTPRPYQEFLDDWAKRGNSYDYKPLGGESVNDGRRRIIETLKEIIEEKNDVLCVTHAGLISNILMMLYSFDFERGKIPCGEICELHIEKEKIKLPANDRNKSLLLNKDLTAPITRLTI